MPYDNYFFLYYLKLFIPEKFRNCKFEEFRILVFSV